MIIIILRDFLNSSLNCYFVQKKMKVIFFSITVTA